MDLDTPGQAERLPDRIMAFDFGHARTGVAYTALGVVSPLKVIPSRHGRPDLQAMDALMEDYAPQLLIVGRPRHLDGKDSRLSVAAENFAQALRNRFDVPVAMHEEGLTSKAAEQQFKTMRRTGTTRRKAAANLDALAAVHILQSYLQQQTSEASSCAT